jgi:hypothetical protein
MKSVHDFCGAPNPVNITQPVLRAGQAALRYLQAFAGVPDEIYSV